MKRIFYGKEFELYDMTGQGIRDLVFDFVPALEFMFLAVQNGERILGGDIVGRDTTGRLVVSSDGWHCGQGTPEATFMETLAYFEQFLKNKRDTDWKVSVVTSRCSEHIFAGREECF